jgi:rubrerythrin
MTGELDKSMAMLATALEKEERGRDFYRDAVSKCSNQLGKDIFKSLMEEEGIHIRRVKLIYDSLHSGKVWSEEWKSLRGTNDNLKALFRQRMIKLGPKVKADSGDVEALDIGLAMEQGAIDFYGEELQRAADSVERDFITCMIGEERIHYEALADIKFYLTNPESWFAEHEHHVLDGA